MLKSRMRKDNKWNETFTFKFIQYYQERRQFFQFQLLYFKLISHKLTMLGESGAFTYIYVLIWYISVKADTFIVINKTIYIVY